MPTQRAEVGLDERRVAMAAIATLVKLKKPLYDLLLKNAGVPEDIYWSLLQRRSPDTNRSLTKREMAPLILDAVEQRGNLSAVVRRIVEQTAQWQAFHLAEDEFEARATVQKARAVLSVLEAADVQAAKEHDVRQDALLERLHQERMTLIRRDSPLLLHMLKDLIAMPNHQQRGRLLELLLTRIFEVHEIPVTGAFSRNGGGEQIDGSFSFEGWHYLVEAKWHERLTDIRQLDSLYGKLARSGAQTFGMFLTMNGCSSHVVPLLKQNAEKRLFLMDGKDLLFTLETPLDLREVLRAKLTQLNLHNEPWFPVEEWRQG